MRIWEDASIFERKLPRLRQREGVKSRYYRFEVIREPQSEIVVMPPEPPGCMLWPRALYRSYLLHGTHHRRESPDFLAIEHLREGVMYFRQDGRMYLIEPGDLFLMRPGTNNEFVIPGNTPCRKSSLLLSGPLVEDLLARGGLDTSDVLPDADGARFESVLDALKELSGSHSRSVRDRVGGLCYELLQTLAYRDANSTVPPELESLLRYMEENLAGKITLDLLAKRYGCSSAQLIRLFNRHLDSTPYHTLLRMRMRLAVRLLAEQRFSVKEVAARVGYHNAMNFTTEFKKLHGHSPQEMRRRGMMALDFT